MMRTAEALIARLARASARGRTLALFFDFDGTLSPIVAHPRIARFPAVTRRTLRALSRLPGVVVGIVSGRRLADLRAKVRLPGILLAGCSGLEMGLRGAAPRPSPGSRSRRILADATAALVGLAKGFPGAWIERKLFGVSLHYRRVTPRRRSSILRLARRILAAHRRGLLVSEGPLAQEAYLDLGADKGTAVREFLRAVGTRPFVLFAGDSGNDDAAFREVQRLRGIPIVVGPLPIASHFRLRDPAALGAFLSLLFRALRARGRAA
ncbi:MAG: trehalose-phosphatase [Planctomycetota bacterium]